MAAQTVLATQAQRNPKRPERIEYLDFHSGPEFREYRFVVHVPEGPAELRVRIPSEAFGAGKVKVQDGPDVCYQKLLRAVAAGEAVHAGVVTLDDPDFTSYLEAHTPVPKHRSMSGTLLPKPPVVPRTPPRPRTLQPRPPSPRPVAPPAAPAVSHSAFGEGQRVSHVVFGAGVVASSSGSHTVVSFDEHGPRTFVTSLVKLELLSAPKEWEIGPRGKNRPRESARAAR
jgi:hypothetical protein